MMRADVETEVLRLHREGMSNWGISRQLGLNYTAVQSCLGRHGLRSANPRSASQAGKARPREERWTADGWQKFVQRWPSLPDEYKAAVMLICGVR